MNTITIVVAGTAGSGKSTITELIATMLRAHKMKVNIVDEHENKSKLLPRVEAVATKSEVTIKTVQVSRHGQLVS